VSSFPGEPNVLEASGLSLSYPGGDGIKQVSITIGQGRLYGFLGRNGAGKSTTIKILAGVYRPDHGQIRFLGETLKEVSAAWKEQIAYVAQNPTFYPWLTGLSLAKLYGQLYPTFDQTYFRELAANLEVPIVKQIKAMSGGNQTKLSLAVCLAYRPKLLLLDEPTAGLDPPMRREVLNILKWLKQNDHSAILFSSHVISEISEVSDDIGIIENGSMIFEGQPEELLRATGNDTLEDAYLSHLKTHNLSCIGVAIER
jgi:ABC-2 type transport system ATP-binding protein